MYYDYFGLKQPPFKITPDTNLFFPGGQRGAILDALVFAVTNGEGIVKVVGEVGSGKTMLCRMLQKELPASVEVVYLANPSLSPENILHAIAFDLHLPVDANTSKILVMHQIQEYLLKKHSQNQQVVVFVEEAQGMPLATIEEIRLLSNLETNQNKLLQIIMFGQPELDQMIGQPNIRQLRDRITYSFQLNPFKILDVKEYINTRLRACGYRAGDLFSDSSIRSIARYSNGLVRRINILADKAMLAAYADNTQKITAKHVRRAARDSEFITSRWRYLLPSAAALVLLTGTVMYWRMYGGGFSDSVAAEQAVVSKVPESKLNETSTAAGAIYGGEPLAINSTQTSPGASSVKKTALNSVANPPGIGDGPGNFNQEKVFLQLSDSLAVFPGNDRIQSVPVGDEPGTNVIATVPVQQQGVTEVLSEPDEEEDFIEQQLIGLNKLFQLQDVKNTRLTD